MSPYIANGQQTTYLPRGSAIQIYAKDLYGHPTLNYARTEYDNTTTLSWIKLTEHNRQEIPISVERIEQSQRMANGELRKFFVADKKLFSFSWTMLPGSKIYTVDNCWGALDLIGFYNKNQGEVFDIRLNFAKSGTSQESSGYEEYTVSCTSFNATLLKRGEVPFYNVSMSMEQV